MATESKFAFDRNISRAAGFVTIHRDAQVGPGAPDNARRELPRAAIVFAVGAIDAYLSEVSAEVLVAQLASEPAEGVTRDLLSRVQKELPTLAIEVSLLPTNKERAERIRESIADHFHNRASNHGSKAVAATVDRVGGDVQDVWTYLRTEDYEKPAKYLDNWTAKRHDIVHKGQRPTVHRRHADNFVEFCEYLVTRIDELAEDCKP